MKTKTILVTGAAGFLGCNISAELLRRGYRVIAIDNLSTGNRANVEPLLVSSEFRFIVHDVIYPLDIPVDVIINLASPASPPRYQADPVGTLKTNVLGTLTLLELAKKYQARFIQASTSEVYGDPEHHPQEETYFGNVNPIGIRACYDEGKRAAEAACFIYKRLHNLDVRVARIFNTYGPYMDKNDGRVVSNFIVHALQGRSLEVFGDGKQTRSLCFVDDMVEAFMRFVEKDGDFSGPINVGNPEEITVLSLARKIIEETKSKSDILFKTLPLDDPTRRKPSIVRAKESLDWAPHISLHEGLVKTIEYFKKELNLGSSLPLDKTSKYEFQSRV